jgi:23S rRNA pseudouridine2605 synthase
MEERLQKIISRAGIASRRAGEEIILAGRVRVNGRVITELGAKADLGRDTVEVDGRKLVGEILRYLVLHKPRGVVSTLSDPEGRPTVASLLEGAGTRLYPVGRLDFATSGVLLVTNDGDFANGLLHPRGGVPKTYVVKAQGVMTEQDTDRWRAGIRLEDGLTRPAEVQFLRHEDGKTWFEITLREGRNQQIRRMGEATGFPVMRLARTSFAGVTSEGLRPGQWRSLSLEELRAIREQFGVPKKARPPAPGFPMVGGTVKPRAARSEEASRSAERRATREEAPPPEARPAAPRRRPASAGPTASPPEPRSAAPRRRPASAGPTASSGRPGARRTRP